MVGLFGISGHGWDMQFAGEFGGLKSDFYQGSNILRATHGNWNPQGHDFAGDYLLEQVAEAAFHLSQKETVNADPFVPGMSYGKGMWPSWQTAAYELFTHYIYGSGLAGEITLQSIFGIAFQYADKALGGGVYTSCVEAMSAPSPIRRYFDAVAAGVAPLNFTLYVPIGYGSLNKVSIPNVEETADPARVLTAHFNQGLQVW